MKLIVKLLGLNRAPKELYLLFVSKKCKVVELHILSVLLLLYFLLFLKKNYMFCFYTKVRLY